MRTFFRIGPDFLLVSGPTWLDAYLTVDSVPPGPLRDAVMLLDAAANENGYARIVGVGRRRRSIPCSNSFYYEVFPHE